MTKKFCESSTKMKVVPSDKEDVKEMTYDRNLMVDLNADRDNIQDSTDEEVEEEGADPKSADKLMPLGMFIGSQNCYLGILGLRQHKTRN